MRNLHLAITTQGDTGTPSIVTGSIYENVLAEKYANGIVDAPVFARVRVCNSAGYANSTNATIAVAGGGTVVETHTSGKDLTIKSAAAAAAAGTLTLTGVVVNGETFTLGSRVYEIDTHGTRTLTAGRVRVNVSASAVKAAGTLTLALQPSANEVINIGGRAYVWVASGTADAPGEISVGANLAAAKVNFVAAINGSDGWNTANAYVSAATFSSNDCVLTALNGGTAGNSIATTENMAGSGNQFDAATIGTTTAGVDCTAANAKTAIISAVNGDTSAVVSAASGAGTTVTATASTAGTAGNSLASTETLANGSFGGSTLSGGTDNGNGLIKVAVTNATAETVTLRFGAPLLSEPGTDFSPTQNVTHAAP